VIPNKPFALSLSKGALRQAQGERHHRSGISAYGAYKWPNWRWSGNLWTDTKPPYL